MNVCRTCKAPIEWVYTRNGYPIPIDPDPTDAGNLRLEPMPAGVTRAVIVPADRRPQHAGQLYRSHFATCPDADEHRRR